MGLNDSILNNDRNSRGGGVLLAIHISIPTKLIPSPPNLEIIVVELIHVKCIVCSVYSPPTVNLTTFTDTLSFLSNLASVQNVLIIGDFNFPDLYWSTLSAWQFCYVYSVILKYINSILKNNNLPVSMCHNEHTVSSDQDKASLFNTFFESVSLILYSHS